MSAMTSRPNPGQQRGFSLIELMIAMTLGLMLLAGIIGVFLGNQQTYRVNEQLNRMQEGARVTHELLVRELREAGGGLCGSNLPTANVLNNRSTAWWANWDNALRGYAGNDNTFPKAFGNGVTDRVAGTDGIVILSGSINEGLVITEHNPNSAQFKVNTTAHGIKDGDILMACDYKRSAIFQVTNASSSNVTIVHNTGSSHTPGNCSKGLGYPTECTSDGNSYTFSSGGFLF